MYCILIRWNDAPFLQVIWSHYGIPKQFKSRLKAEKWIKKMPVEHQGKMEVKDLRVGVKYSKIKVEVFSGRRNERGKIIDKSKAKYEDMLPSLIHSAKSYKRDQLVRRTGRKDFTVGLIKFKKSQFKVRTP